MSVRTRGRQFGAQFINNPETGDNSILIIFLGHRSENRDGRKIEDILYSRIWAENQDGP